MEFDSVLDKVISQHLDELRKPGVLTVRPGYQVAGGWPTKKPAIVVTVAKKGDNVPPEDRLPEQIDGFAVDVRQATPLQRLRVTNPALYTSLAATVSPEQERPIFPYERDLTSGQSLEAAAASVQAMRKTSKAQLRYVPPAGAPLKAVTDEMTIICHASPDAGWPTLKSFLEDTTASLTVGMYDFTSTHIVETVQAALKTRKSLNLVLDHPPTKKTREQTDDQTVEDLESTLGKRFKFAWALERSDPKVATWIFPSAYHIKVAVRDSEAFWLSSGNWNTTNQPDIDPLTDPIAAAPIVRKSDRDWHVIVEHEGLAKLYEKYLLNDLTVAAENQAGAADMAEALSALAALADSDEIVLAAKVPQQYFAPQTIKAKMKIQPILSPDNYVDLILQLIDSAEDSLYMQTQYINYSDKPENAKFAALIAAVAKKIKDGLDVRLIMSQYETADKLELIQTAGIDLSHVRIQSNVHNKGIIVDSKIVAVGSQNWSGDGVLRNRDATVIIYNEAAAQYWETIFIHDWTKMASQQAAD